MNISLSEDGTILQNQVSFKKRTQMSEKDLSKTSSAALTVKHPWLQFDQSEPLLGPEKQEKQSL